LSTIIVRWGKLNRVLRSAWLCPIFVALLYQSWTLHYKPWNQETLILLTIVFTAIAAGNSICGMLDNKTARKLGEVSYGIYLFHGLILYGIFQLSHVGRLAAVQSPSIYLMTILAITVLTVSLSSVGFHLVEAPAMALVNPITSKLRNSWRQIRQS